jgi:hypothetical protein
VSNPPKHALPLLEALKAWAEGGVLVESLCRIGEWRCWARRGSRDGPWVELPAKAWDERSGPRIDLPALGIAGHLPDPERLRIISPDCLVRLTLREVRERQRDGEIKIFERLVTDEEWFDPRFAPTDSIPPVRTQRDRAASRKAVERWVKDNFEGLPSEQVPNRPQMLELAQAELGDWVKPTWIKELKPPSRAGRRKSGGK